MPRYLSFACRPAVSSRVAAIAVVGVHSQHHTGDPGSLLLTLLS